MIINAIFVRSSFRLNENLNELYAEWAKRDVNFDLRVKSFPESLNGIRVLRLNPVENLFSFICKFGFFSPLE